MVGVDCGVMERAVKDLETLATLGLGEWVYSDDMLPTTNIAGRLYRTAEGELHRAHTLPLPHTPQAWFFPSQNYVPARNSPPFRVGQEIRWRRWGDGKPMVSTGWHPSSRAALVSSLKAARAVGWTPPRWWEWWRWGDRDYRRDLLDIRKHRNA